MAFYNVSNPLNFTNLDDSAARIAPLSALTTIPAPQYFTGASSLSVSQTIAGSIVYAGPTGSITLPKPQDILAGLRNSVKTDLSSIGENDMLAFHVRSDSGACIVQGVDRLGSASTSQIVASGTYLPVILRFENVTSGSEAYTVL